MNNGFNSQSEMQAAEFRPLIDANRVDSYPRKSRLDWLLLGLTITAISMIGALWMN